MISTRPGRHWPHALLAALAIAAAPLAAFAQTAAPQPAAKAAPKPAAKAKAPSRATAKKAPVAPVVEYAPAEAASAEQLDAAERVYYGIYDCEFKQTIDIVRNLKYPGFVDVKHAKAVFVMKPVLSSTGAIRLEDIRGETLMVQISSKSMLLNVVTAHRIVDDCVSPRQRELIEAARAAKAAAAASAAESGNAAPAPANAALLGPGSAAASAPK